MKIAILHISDIHFEDGENPVAGRARKIKSAVQAADSQIEACIVAVTGDVAFSGKGSEYALAASFFSELAVELRSMRPNIAVEFVFVAGNHDCDLSGPSEVRQLLIDSMPPRVSSLDPNGGIAKQCLQVQDEFFDFEARFTGEGKLEGGDRLFCQRAFDFGGRRIKFNCYNTAWLAQIGDDLPPLLYPVHVAAARLGGAEASSDYVISLFHYPYTWLEPNNSMEFKKHVDRTSDFILSGHEHTPSSYLKQYSTGGEVFYLEGAALQETGGTKSGFNVLLLDLAEGRQKTFHFEWRDNIYSPTKGHEAWRPLVRNSLISRARLENTAEFERFLTSVGTGFTHSRKKELRLRDLFVYPDLREALFDKKIRGKSNAKSVDGEEILNFISDNPYVVIIGDREAGKTTLAKVLYEDFRRRGLYPLFLRAGEIGGASGDDFSKSMGRAFASQYEADKFEHYKQLEKGERVLIVDNFHKCSFNAEGQNTFLQNAVRWFGTVVLLADDLFHLEVLTSSSGDPDAMREFSHCSIRAFGWRKRKHLIEKWLRLGQEFTLSNEDLVRELNYFERVISSLIGKNLLPAYPVLVLSVLQIAEATKNHNLGAGSQGYIYEALITETLAKISRKPSDLDKIYAFLTHVAYEMFVRESRALNRDDIQEVSDAYFQRFGARFDNVDALLASLEQFGVMRFAKGMYRFEPSYYYYYFVARYFKDQLGDSNLSEGLRRQMREIVDTVHYEEYAQILIFLIYLTKDAEIIARIRENAAKIYSEYTPCDLKADVDFINQISTSLPERHLPSTSPEENNEERRRHLDNIEDETEAHRINNRGEKIKYSEEVDDLVKLNIAFKTMELMGQVVRNFPYSLVAETKEAIVRECELLGLRTLNAILAISRDNLEQAKSYYRQVIRERRALISDSEAEAEAANFMFWLTSAIGYGIIKKVSHSAGAEELSPIFKRVLDTLEPRLSVRMIDVSVKLDHFRGVPVAEIEKLSEELSGNAYSFILLRDMVLDYLYLFHSDQATKQRLAEALKFKVNDPELYDSRHKRLSLPSRGKSG